MFLEQLTDLNNEFLLTLLEISRQEFTFYSRKQYNTKNAIWHNKIVDKVTVDSSLKLKSEFIYMKNLNFKKGNIFYNLNDNDIREKRFICEIAYGQAIFGKIKKVSMDRIWYKIKHYVLDDNSNWKRKKNEIFINHNAYTLPEIKIHRNPKGDRIEIKFSAKTKFWNSAFNAELMGLLSAIYVCNNENMIIKKKLMIDLYKVQVHNSDIYNEKIDHLVKETHKENNRMLTFKGKNINGIDIIPLWKNLIIEKNIRKFLSDMAQDQELPTIEQVKKSIYGIYKDILCPICNQEEESFEHKMD
ncbi:hypothetical protein C1645_841089 [Glomus cerebriforme]|uniref:Uncharacterized protein n=1 Tax=Glomus cerebriforme TaxID=658196 RepID=A0A397S5L5_9GLOM|nr:hypothetical protein C1645_841089 [Glomus cerebriforme]